jgi:hypothetical protein
MDIHTYARIALLATLALGLALIIHGTLVKNRWGINLRPVSCPDCGTQIGQVRAPKSGNQAMWGGHTCPFCKCEMDKWGRPIARPV